MLQRHESISLSTPDNNALAARQVAAVLSVGQAMVATGDYEQVLSAVIAAVCQSVAATTGGFMLHDVEHDELVLQKPAFGVHSQHVVERYRVPLSAGSNAARVFLSRAPYIANDARADPRMVQRFIELFNARNTLTVALLLGEQTIGVFHAINKQHGEFTADDLAVIELVAPLLATVLKTAQMFKTVKIERHKQERIMHVHSALTRTMVDAPGIEPLCRTLSELLRRPVAVFDVWRRLLADHDWPVLAPTAIAQVRAALSPEKSSYALSVVDADGERFAFSTVTIMLGEEPGGYITVGEAGAALDPIDRKAVEQAATIFALELLKERSAFEVERRATGDLFNELFRDDTTHADAATILRRLGWPARGPWRVLRFLFSGSDRNPNSLPHDAQERRALASVLAEHKVATPLLPWRNGFITVATDEAAAHLSSIPIHRALDLHLQTGAISDERRHLWIGVGRAEAATNRLNVSLKSAEQALAAAQRLAIDQRAVFFEELGVYRLILSANQHSDHQDFIEQVLGQVYQAERAARTSTLITTLEQLSKHDFKVAAVAHALEVHPNTIKYRQRKLTELLGGDPARGELRLEVELALKLVKLPVG